MAWQGWDLELTAYAARDWRATFYVTGMAHSIVGGSAWEPTPWRAVQADGLVRSPRIALYHGTQKKEEGGPHGEDLHV